MKKYKLYYMSLVFKKTDKRSTSNYREIGVMFSIARINDKIEQYIDIIVKNNFIEKKSIEVHMTFRNSQVDKKLNIRTRNQ